MSKKPVHQLKPRINKEILQAFNDGYMNDWATIPADPNTKRPTISWQQYQHVAPAWEDIQEWIKTAEGVALVTGRISGVVILDVDTKKGKDGFKALKDKHLPITPTVRTKNGGYHYYFKYPDAGIKSYTGIFEGVDIQSDKKIAIMAGTPGYEWVDGLSIDDVPLADPPEWMQNLKVKPAESLDTKGIERGVASNEYLLLAPPPRNPGKPASILGSLNRDQLRIWYSSQEVAERFLSAYELDVKIGEAFNSILPGEADKNPSASLYQGDNGIFIYRNWRGSGSDQVLLLPEVYASTHYKKIVTMDKVQGLTDKTISASELSVWAIRLLVDLYIIEPVKVPHKPHRSDFKPTEKKVYESFVKLLACKWLYSYGDPTPFSWRFAKVWAGVSERKAGEAMNSLLKKGYIVQAGSEMMNGREVALFTVKKG